MTDHYCVFGNPIAQSRSPQIHRAFAEQTGEDIQYDSQLVEVDQFENAAKVFFSAGGKGLNITAPFKADAYAFATRLSPRARRAGAVNTLAVQEDGSILGDTTDGVGLVKDLRANLGWPVQGKRLLILGAGGAARGVLQALFEQGPQSICIANRTAAKAFSLAKGFADLGDIKGMGLDQLEECDAAFDLVISATSAGLSGEGLHLPDSIIGVDSCAYDMIYRSEPTSFMRWAEARGAKTSDGLGMLVGQAAESFKIWRGVEPQIKGIIAELRVNL